MFTWRRLAAASLLLCVPAGARAQLTASGEVTATAGSRDGAAFFNYTDYEHNALRMFRVSLAGMWRAGSRLALLGEVRSEDAQRLIPYAVYARVRPFAGRPFFVQAGRIPPVFGAFSRRSYGTEGNALIGYPLAYQYLTSLRPDAIPASADDLLAMRGRGWRATFPIGSAAQAPGVPLMSAYRWDTGVEAYATGRRIDGSVAVTRGTLSKPRVRDDNDGVQVSGRVAWKPIVGLVVGASAARGAFLARSVANLGAVRTDGPFTQRALGVDAEYSRDYWIVRGEVIASRWTLPALAAPSLDDPLGAIGGFLEGRYRFGARYFAAARADRLTFSKVRGQRLFGGEPTTWDAPVTRVEVGAGLYLRRNLTARAAVQRNWRDGGRITARTFLSGQLAYWF
ncbi:MAG TPA: hypothetical protein VFK57_23980 [Vicinamibacterales bacterium]|nr:hypothetical protein [Vicinamibacterales bacterium]